jgi:stress-induced-phosphoprotein 1
MEPAVAMKDAEKCLALDPNFIKGHIRKASCHSLMKEFHKALQAYEQGLKIDPENKECKEGYAKTI